MTLDLIIEDDRWTALGLETLAGAAVRATFDHLSLGDHEIALLACDDARIAVLNAAFRDKPAATNVLSWPSEHLAPATDGAKPAPPREFELGDIAIAYDTCAAEATATGTPIAHHVTHLIVHGALHLLGYDHLRDGDATLMEALETEILGNLGIPDPY